MKQTIDEAQLTVIQNHPDYMVLKRVHEFYETLHPSGDVFIATILDLETMGMNAKEDEIIELGLLSFSFTNEDDIVSVMETYNELNEPSKPIPEEITQITGITNEDVRGKAINWPLVHQLLSKSHLVLCHNAKFDRNFLELQTPDNIKAVVEKKPFGCTVADIDWRQRGYESAKLEYLNFKLGFFYEGHRALVDCWATLNLLIQERGAFEELKAGVRKKQIIICATNAAFEKKDLLKERKYRWSDGTSSLPKCWWIIVDKECIQDEKHWLDDKIYGYDGAADSLPIKDHRPGSW